MKSTLRQCPRGCGDLRSQTSQGIEVDICAACHGIWLDAGEFDPLVAQRFSGEPLEAYFALTAEEVPSVQAARCPSDGADLYVTMFGEIELDWCPSCHGIWIDGAERSEVARSQNARATSGGTARIPGGVPSQATEDDVGPGQVQSRAGGDDVGPGPVQSRAGGDDVGGDRVQSQARGGEVGQSAEAASPVPVRRPADEHVVDFSSDGQMASGSEVGSAGVVGDGVAQASSPGPRMVEFDSPGESVELELDLSFQERGAADQVVCASCGEVVRRQRAITVMEAFWCESCVVEGDFPGAMGPPTARRRAAAAQALSKAKSNQEEKKEATKALASANEHRSRSRFGRNQYGDLETSLGAAAKMLRSVFFGDK